MALILDGTDGIGISGDTQPMDSESLNAVIQALIPTGTKMMFVQTTAPTGWTKDTTHDNKALRVVSGTASTGGTVAFTTAFASKVVSGSIGNTTATNNATTAGGSVGSTTITTTSMPSHNHVSYNQLILNYSSPTITISGADGNFIYGAAGGTSSTGGNGSHNHSFSGSSHSHTQNAHNHSFTGTDIDMAVQYVDTIIATKD